MAALIVALPFLYGILIAPPGAMFLGEPIAMDDTMVYAAWIRQAMDGQFLFDNRFTLDAQPGLTVHLYFWVLGLLAKVTGIPLALTLARVVFSGVFVWSAYQLIRRVTPDNYLQKLGVVITVIAGGLGFLVWHTFGIAHVKGSPLASLTQGRLPIDVWQTEAFVFPSMLENGLFMVSLCLILAVFVAVIEARDSWKPVPLGMIAMAVLMNIHSYDVLLIAMVLVAFLVVSVVGARNAGTTQPAITVGMWSLRAVCIGLGALPSALWFIRVLERDEVFKARAATETYSPNFQTLVAGLIVVIVLGLMGLLRAPGEEAHRKRGVYGLAGVLVVGYLVAIPHAQGYWLAMPAFLVGMLIAVALAVLLRTGRPAHDLVVCWALVGLVAPYFPALFQRKLSMGIVVPWAILAALGFGWLLGQRERGRRNLGAAFGFALLGATSLMWFVRDLSYIRDNVSRTTVHPVYLTSNVQQIVEKLNLAEGKKTAIAMPGIPLPIEVDRYDTPYLPDLNPIISGLTGAYTFAGHWSETPDYNARRTDATMFFLAPDPQQRRDFLTLIGVEYIIAPVPEAFADIEQATNGRSLVDMRDLGEVLVDGPQFRLIRVSR